MSSEFAANGGIHGSLTGISIGVGVSSTQKVWRSLQAFGDIAFAYSFSNILIEIQQTLVAHRCLLCFVAHDTIKAPPLSEVKVMKSATRLSVVTTTVFYMLCGCMGYALSDNLLTGLGFYESFWLLDIANVVHLVGAYQVFVQPIFVFVERWASCRPCCNGPYTVKEPNCMLRGPRHNHSSPPKSKDFSRRLGPHQPTTRSNTHITPPVNTTPCKTSPKPPMLHRIAALRPPPPPPPSPWRAAAAAAGYASKSTTLPQKQQRVRDHAFDGIMEVQKRVRRFLALHSLLLYAAAPTALAGGGGGAVSVPFSRLGALARRQLRLAPLDAGRFLLRHPHAFHLFLHPVHRVLHARLTPRAVAALRLEADAVASSLPASIVRIRKLLLLAPPHHRLRLEHIRLLRRDLGLPDDFAESIIQAHPALFRLTPDQFVEFVPSPSDPPGLSVAAVERAREQHYREHRNPGAGEEDVRFAFPTRFPPGFKIGKYFRIAVWKWQRLPYASPYADVSGHDLRSLEARRRMEKRAVAAVHELLSLTVEKRTTLERLALFRDALGVPKKIKEFLLKYQGIFYISTRGNQGKLHTVFLREAYYKGELVEPNEIYAARRKLEELLMLNPQKANLDRMFTSMGRGWDELGGGRRGGAELREEFLGEASDRRTNTKVDGEYGGDSGDDSGVESLYIE
ncbi:hypothetical protein OsI_02874 [Oryza sativa Indica Group]|uniref:PORR domain-containing protein n=1 Tax=Oryza sativa subsp. indica TaxID=39946 RepID=A2WSN0_ORYSI|nr:hypothetical protein OsI_02874 [Oryza sativa Indica Group]